MSLEQDLSKIKDKLENIKTKKIESESTLKVLEKEKQQLLDECTKLGVDPKKIQEEVDSLEAQLQKEVAELKKQLDGIDV